MLEQVTCGAGIAKNGTHSCVIIIIAHNPHLMMRLYQNEKKKIAIFTYDLLQEYLRRVV